MATQGYDAFISNIPSEACVEISFDPNYRWLTYGRFLATRMTKVILWSLIHIVIAKRCKVLPQTAGIILDIQKARYDHREEKTHFTLRLFNLLHSDIPELLRGFNLYLFQVLYSRTKPLLWPIALQTRWYWSTVTINEKNRTGKPQDWFFITIWWVISKNHCMFINMILIIQVSDSRFIELTWLIKLSRRWKVQFVLFGISS